MRAPEFPGLLEWFNVASPIQLKDLRGKVILLDFWTYCCINCMHILPDLRYLEEKYPDDLVVIGLHSPKFANERIAGQLSKAIQRYDIRHPIANDPSLSVWQQYAVHAWPTLVLIDANSEIVEVLAGEGHRNRLDALIKQYIENAKTTGVLQSAPMDLKLEHSELHNTLLFPGKIIATADKLYISDSGHHRILETDLTGNVLQKFGCEVPGLQDGPAGEARFNNPQGLANFENKLWVADTDNHAIRCINLDTGHVTTIAGTGKMGMRENVRSILPLYTPINSPWDICYHHNFLYIAMAGCHQLWRIDLHAQRMEVWAGSGIENIQNGSPSFAAFAQPSGVSASAHALYVADSEVSAIRQIDFSSTNTTTLIGTGLFDYGDKDGIGLEAKLQHPLGVTYDQVSECLWIADTYNQKIKRYDILSHLVIHLDLNLPVNLNEPGGINYSAQVLWIADTNNHRIIRFDIVSKKATELTIHPLSHSSECWHPETA